MTLIETFETSRRTPRPAQSAMIGGLAALDAELGWFEGHAEALGQKL